MLLEQVEPHYCREEIYVNRVITPHPLVKMEDRLEVNKILFKEFNLENFIRNISFSKECEKN